MNSERDTYKVEFMQQIPRRSFLGSDAEYQERMETYVSSRASQSEHINISLVDFVLAGGNLFHRSL